MKNAVKLNRKINSKMHGYISIYLDVCWRYSQKDLPKLLTKNVPKNLRYGGHRNTCYDWR